MGGGKKGRERKGKNGRGRGEGGSERREGFTTVAAEGGGAGGHAPTCHYCYCFIRGNVQC